MLELLRDKGMVLTYSGVHLHTFQTPITKLGKPVMLEVGREHPYASLYLQDVTNYHETSEFTEDWLDRHLEWIDLYYDKPCSS